MHAAIATMPVLSQKPGVRHNQILRLKGLQRAVRDLLQEKGWTVTDAAERADKSRTWMSLALNAKADPDGTYADVLANFLSGETGYNVVAEYDVKYRVVRRG